MGLLTDSSQHRSCHLAQLQIVELVQAWLGDLYQERQAHSHQDHLYQLPNWEVAKLSPKGRPEEEGQELLLQEPGKSLDGIRLLERRVLELLHPPLLSTIQAGLLRRAERHRKVQ